MDAQDLVNLLKKHDMDNSNHKKSKKIQISIKEINKLLQPTTSE